MILADALGTEQVRDRVKIYATDADEVSLSKARLAQYDGRDIESIPPESLGRYFDLAGGRYAAPAWVILSAGGAVAAGAAVYLVLRVRRARAEGEKR